jgi:hypothetical protein
VASRMVSSGGTRPPLPLGRGKSSCTSCCAAANIAASKLSMYSSDGKGLRGQPCFRPSRARIQGGRPPLGIPPFQL